MKDMLLLELSFLNFRNGWIPMIYCIFPLEVLLDEDVCNNSGLIVGQLLIVALSLNLILIIILYY